MVFREHGGETLIPHFLTMQDCVEGCISFVVFGLEGNWRHLGVGLGEDSGDEKGFRLTKGGERSKIYTMIRPAAQGIQQSAFTKLSA